MIGSCDLGWGVLQSQVRLAREKRTENRAETGESPRTNGERNEVSSFFASRAVREGRGCFRLAGRSGGAREEGEVPRGARPVCREKLSYTERYAGYACCPTRKLVRVTPRQADPVQLLTVDLAGVAQSYERYTSMSRRHLACLGVGSSSCSCRASPAIIPPPNEAVEPSRSLFNTREKKLFYFPPWPTSRLSHTFRGKQASVLAPALWCRRLERHGPRNQRVA